MSITKITEPNALTGNWRCWIVTPTNLSAFKPASGTWSWLAADAAAYNVEMTLNSEGRGASADVPANLPDGHYFAIIFNTIPTDLTASRFSQREIFVHNHELVTDATMINHLHAYVFAKATRLTTTDSWNYYDWAGNNVIITGPIPGVLSRACAVVS